MYRELLEEDGEIDTYIEVDTEQYRNKLFFVEHEPRLVGSGKLGQYGSDERLGLKRLAEKGRARVLQMRHELKREDETFTTRTNRRISHAQEYEPDSDRDFVSPDPGKNRFESFSNYGNDDGTSMDAMSEIGPVPDKQSETPAKITGVKASKHTVWCLRPSNNVALRNTSLRMRVGLRYLLAKNKPLTGRRPGKDWENISKQRRIS